MLFLNLYCKIIQYEINICKNNSLSIKLSDMLLSLIRSSNRSKVIWGKLYTREQEHAFLNASISKSVIM